MKILLISIGSRGDMEPFLAIGALLKKRGHEITCAMPEQVKDHAKNTGLQFESLGKEYFELIKGDLAKKAMGSGGSFIKKIIPYIKLAFASININKEIIRRQEEIINRLTPDIIIYSGKAMYPIIWHLKTNAKIVLISPVPYLQYIKDRAHVGFQKSFGKTWIKFTYSLADFAISKTLKASCKWLKSNVNYTRKQLLKAWQTTPTIYTISPALFQKPKYWPSYRHVLGFHERDKTVDWKPSHELTTFLKKHQKPICITFGSMQNNTPKKTAQHIINILQKNRIPTIIISSWGGLEPPANYDKNLIHFEQSIPHDWLFPQMYAVVHHGGSGTTHMGLKNGCASMLVPHIVDQFAWNDIAAKLGVGPHGLPIDKIHEPQFEENLLDLYTKSSYKEKAEQLAKTMDREQKRLTNQLCKTIEQL